MNPIAAQGGIGNMRIRTQAKVAGHLATLRRIYRAL